MHHAAQVGVSLGALGFGYALCCLAALRFGHWDDISKGLHARLQRKARYARAVLAGSAFLLVVGTVVHAAG
ncbi:hypothetical protein ACWC2T_41010 [Streptomyces sp. NPDC001393]